MTFNKNYNSLLENYIIDIMTKCQPMLKNSCKIKSNKLEIPTIQTYPELLQFKYTVEQLKQFAKHYNLKLSGNKTQLINRLYCFLYLSNYAIIIQKLIRSALVKKYIKLRGPASFYSQRNLCTNNTDFITMEPIEEIKFHYFISYKDADGFIYGFDIRSLYNLWLKATTPNIHNPYNRSIIPLSLLANIKRLCKLSRIFKNRINLKMEEDTTTLTISDEKLIEIRAVTLFQHIDSLGNYSNANWFLSLSRLRLLQFINKLYDVWNYRAQLPYEIKIKVCPPYGNPFRNINLQGLHNPNLSILTIQKILLEIMEKFIRHGIDKDSKALGAYYILGCLTLVNPETAESLPWLFQSFL
jgi:hypothetical protein